ncbi:barstar family protein [Micromonospora chokoriensis]|uniref:barstar family protein n=1 Tax=Micromonospora chokoriensis TaxID=356851 RepID=UPI000689B771|nr:barstar family protein [Micromonospora chokoriensis]
MIDDGEDRMPDWLIVCRDDAPELPDSVALAGTATRTRAGLFVALATALALPAYLGDTWDALADVLRDRLDAGPLTLLITDAGQLLADEPADQYALLLTVLGNLAGSASHPLRVVLDEAPPAHGG